MSFITRRMTAKTAEEFGWMRGRGRKIEEEFSYPQNSLSNAVCRMPTCQLERWKAWNEEAGGFRGRWKTRDDVKSACVGSRQINIITLPEISLSILHILYVRLNRISLKRWQQAGNLQWVCDICNRCGPNLPSISLKDSQSLTTDYTCWTGG